MAVGFNKLLVTRVETAERYARSFDEDNVRMDYGLGYPWSLKTLPFLSRPLRIFYVPSTVRSNSWRARVAHLHRTSPWSRRPLPATFVGVVKRLFA